MDLLDAAVERAELSPDLLKGTLDGSDPKQDSQPLSTPGFNPIETLPALRHRNPWRRNFCPAGASGSSPVPTQR